MEETPGDFTLAACTICGARLSRALALQLPYGSMFQTWRSTAPLAHNCSENPHVALSGLVSHHQAFSGS